MPRVLIAVDASADAVRSAQAAHTLFGDSADYFVINVGLSPVEYSWATGWGIAAPVSMPLSVNTPLMLGVDPDDDDGADAQERAAEVAGDAELGGAEALGDVGDPATAILGAAHEHNIDVIVVGSHRRHWFDRLVTRSVSRDVLRDSDVPVLVVPDAPEQPDGND